MNKASLKISISPRDYRFIKQVLPHQLSVWHQQVNEILIIFDLHGYDSEEYQVIISDIALFIESLMRPYSHIRLLRVDYGEKAKKEISKQYFNSRVVPEKTHRYGPYYAYFYGLYQTKNDYVLNIDSDIFFGGHNPNWIAEAIEILSTENNVITCSPLPGPPTRDGKLISQQGQTDGSKFRKIYFDGLSTRIFFIHKPTFISKICPIPLKIAGFSLLLRALLRNRPVYALPEDVITRVMIKKSLKRVDFLGGKEGIWSLHPPFRNELFYKSLPDLIEQIEQAKIPDGQKGDHDINDCMINWDDARAEIRKASLKRKLLQFIKINI
jgi:hypothetical protein